MSHIVHLQDHPADECKIIEQLSQIPDDDRDKIILAELNYMHAHPRDAEALDANGGAMLPVILRISADSILKGTAEFLDAGKDVSRIEIASEFTHRFLDDETDPMDMSQAIEYFAKSLPSDDAIPILLQLMDAAPARTAIAISKARAPDRDLLLADHLLRDHWWRRSNNFPETANETAQLKKLFADLSTRPQWWTRLYVAHEMSLYSYLVNAETMQRLKEDREKFIRDVVNPPDDSTNK